MDPQESENPEEARVAEVSVADEDLCSAFRVAVDVVEASLDSGAVFPNSRLLRRHKAHGRYAQGAAGVVQEDSSWLPKKRSVVLASNASQVPSFVQ